MTGLIRHRFSDTFSVQGGVQVQKGQTSDVLSKIDYFVVGTPVSVIYDSTDRPLDPTRGFKFAASITPYPAFLGSTVGMTVSRATASAYYSLDEDSRYILAARVSAGSIVGANLYDIPANFRFFAGGGGSVRGYRYQSLGPTGPFGFVVGGRSLLEGSLEARIKITDTIGVVPFVDAGNAFLVLVSGLQGPTADSRRVSACATTRPSARSASTWRLRSTSGRGTSPSPSMSASGRRSDAEGFCDVLPDDLLRRIVPAALVLVVVGAVATTTRSAEADRSFLADLISKALSTPATRVSVGSVEGALSSNSTIRDVTIADRDGVWLRVNEVRLEWSRLALLSRRLEVNKLEIGRLEFLREPLPSEVEVPDSDQPILPELPVKVAIADFNLRELVLGEPVIGTAARLSASGNASLGAPAEGLRLVFDARRLDAPGTLSARLNYNASALTLALNVDEPANGLLARAGNIPGLPPVKLDLNGNGTLDAFGARLDLHGRSDHRRHRTGPGRPHGRHAPSWSRSRCPDRRAAAAGRGPGLRGHDAPRGRDGLRG